MASLIDYVMEKLKGILMIIESFGGGLVSIVDNIFQFPTEIKDYTMKKLNEVLTILESYGQSVISMVDNIVQSPAEFKDYTIEKLKEVLTILESYGQSLISKVDELFPPETREEQIKYWFHVAQPYIIAGVVLFLLIFCCRCCCCSGRGGGRSVRMMKAPGRNYMMPRSPFEINPKAYFRSLRGHTIHERV